MKRLIPFLSLLWSPLAISKLKANKAIFCPEKFHFSLTRSFSCLTRGELFQWVGFRFKPHGFSFKSQVELLIKPFAFPLNPYQAFSIQWRQWGWKLAWSQQSIHQWRMELGREIVPNLEHCGSASFGFVEDARAGAQACLEVLEEAYGHFINSGIEPDWKLCFENSIQKEEAEAPLQPSQVLPGTKKVLNFTRWEDELLVYQRILRSRRLSKPCEIDVMHALFELTASPEVISAAEEKKVLMLQSRLVPFLLRRLKAIQSILKTQSEFLGLSPQALLSSKWMDLPLQCNGWLQIFEKLSLFGAKNSRFLKHTYKALETVISSTPEMWLDVKKVYRNYQVRGQDFHDEFGAQVKIDEPILDNLQSFKLFKALGWLWALEWTEVSSKHLLALTQSPWQAMDKVLEMECFEIWKDAIGLKLKSPRAPALTFFALSYSIRGKKALEDWLDEEASSVFLSNALVHRQKLSWLLLHCEVREKFCSLPQSMFKDFKAPKNLSQKEKIEWLCFFLWRNWEPHRGVKIK